MTEPITSLIDTVKALDALYKVGGITFATYKADDSSGGNVVSCRLCGEKDGKHSDYGSFGPCPVGVFETQLAAAPRLALECERLTQENTRLRMIAQLIGRIYFYGDFKAETFNERQLEGLLREVGCRYLTEEEVLNDPMRQFLAAHST